MSNPERLEFKRITLREQGMTCFVREHEVLKKANGMEASLYDGAFNNDDFLSKLKCRVAHAKRGQSEYQELARKLQELGVSSWNGFDKTAMYVLDGDTFSLDIELVNGDTIHAYGSNAYPKGYGDFVNLLEEAVHGPKEN